MSVDGPSNDPTEGNLYHSLLKHAGESHRLFSVHWELTYRCNQKCSHCYLDVLPASDQPEGELTTAECLGIIDQIAGLGALNLTLSGGEVFVRRDWYEIAAYARSKRLLLRLFSNGLRLNSSLADKIASLHPYSVEISLYSPRPAVHDAITRIPGAWQRTVRGVRLLRARGVRVQLKTPLLRENFRDLDALEALAAELDAGFRYGLTLTPKDSGALDPLVHRLSYAELVEFMRTRFNPQPWLERTRQPDANPCGIARLALSIDPYGNVAPCLDVRHWAGNLRRTPLRELWETAPVWAEMRALTLDTLTACRDCALQNLCARCHGLAERENGDLRGPALVSCLQALARRQVLIERGLLPADAPLPPHLLAYAQANPIFETCLPTPLPGAAGLVGYPLDLEPAAYVRHDMQPFTPRRTSDVARK